MFVVLSVVCLFLLGYFSVVAYCLDDWFLLCLIWTLLICYGCLFVVLLVDLGLIAVVLSLLCCYYEYSGWG